MSSGGTCRGTLFLVVGPSGAGKDTLIAAAQRALAGDPRFVFARRVVTRPPDPGGEAHEAASDAEFTALARDGGFALAWSAHGLRYGIRSEVAAMLAGGRHVVVNLSRAVVAEARARFDPAIVIEVTAAPEALARRLAARGRESAADIARRLARTGEIAPDECGVICRVDNSGELATAVRSFLGILRQALPGPND